MGLSDGVFIVVSGKKRLGAVRGLVGSHTIPQGRVKLRGVEDGAVRPLRRSAAGIGRRRGRGRRPWVGRHLGRGAGEYRHRMRARHRVGGRGRVRAAVPWLDRDGDVQRRERMVAGARSRCAANRRRRRCGRAGSDVLAADHRRRANGALLGVAVGRVSRRYRRDGLMRGRHRRAPRRGGVIEAVVSAVRRGDRVLGRISLVRMRRHRRVRHGRVRRRRWRAGVRVVVMRGRRGSRRVMVRRRRRGRLDDVAVRVRAMR